RSQRLGTQTEDDMEGSLFIVPGREARSPELVCADCGTQFRPAASPMVSRKFAIPAIQRASPPPSSNTRNCRRRGPCAVNSPRTNAALLSKKTPKNSCDWDCCGTRFAERVYTRQQTECELLVRTCDYDGLVAGLFREIIVLVEIVVHLAGDVGGMRTVDDVRASAQKNDDYEFRMVLIGVRSKPTQTSALGFIVAGAGLAESLLAFGIVALARSAVKHGGKHSLAELWKKGRDRQSAANSRREILGARFGRGILQVVHGAAVGDGGDDGSQLQRRDFNSFTETAHPRDTAVYRRLRREKTRLLASDVVTGAFTEAKNVIVMPDVIKAEATSQLFKKRVVRVGQRFGHIHIAATADFDHC